MALYAITIAFGIAGYFWCTRANNRVTALLTFKENVDVLATVDYLTRKGCHVVVANGRRTAIVHTHDVSLLMDDPRWLCILDDRDIISLARN